jgi:hypothetical protein
MHKWSSNAHIKFEVQSLICNLEDATFNGEPHLLILLLLGICSRIELIVDLEQINIFLLITHSTPSSNTTLYNNLLGIEHVHGRGKQNIARTRFKGVGEYKSVRP